MNKSTIGATNTMIRFNENCMYHYNKQRREGKVEYHMTWLIYWLQELESLK